MNDQCEMINLLFCVMKKGDRFACLFNEKRRPKSGHHFFFTEMVHVTQDAQLQPTKTTSGT